MALRTSTVPARKTETFDEKDRTEIHTIITNLRETYVEQLSDANRAYHAAQRQVNRTEHELHRLERHLQRIEDFCNKNNIPLEG